MPKSEPSPPTALPIVVFAQVHYPDIWRGMSSLLERRLTLPFRLVVTTSHPPESIARPRSRHLVETRVLPAENRGRDVLPFLRAMAATEGYEIGLKLHTKKSPQRADGARWLQELLESLVPPAPEAIVARLRADRRIGFVAPASFCLPVEPWVLQNGPAMERVLAGVGHTLVPSDMAEAYFAAGNMFWFRRDALQALAAEHLPALFEPEEAQLDGTIAHAMERVFPVEARRQGYLTVAMPALMAATPDTPAADLMAATRRHAEEPNFLFPAPYIKPASAEFQPPAAVRLRAEAARLSALWLGRLRRLAGWSLRRLGLRR